MEAKRIVVTVLIQKPIRSVWQCWTIPEHIKQWNIPFPDWHCPVVENNVKAGGKFRFEMKNTDGMEGFDHAGVYDNIIPYELIEYTLDDGRKSSIEFQQIDENTIVRESFEPEENAHKNIQEDFCSSVLEKFKNYVETNYG